MISGYFLESDAADEPYPLRHTVEGCSTVSYEKHDYILKIYGYPDTDYDYSESDEEIQIATHSQCVLEYRQRAYILGSKSLKEANNEKNWMPDLTLVTAQNVGERQRRHPTPSALL